MIWFNICCLQKLVQENVLMIRLMRYIHDDVIKWKHFPRNWPFVRGIHRSPVNSPHKGQWRGTLMFSLICVWINGWVNNREAGDLRRYRAPSWRHCNVHRRLLHTDDISEASVCTYNTSPSRLIIQWLHTSHECHGFSNHRQLDCMSKLLL